MTENGRQQILDSFLERWPLDELESLELPEYVGVRNRDTFCQWVETKTRILGSIKGGTSYKFGIFRRKRRPEDNEKSSYFDDGEYTWVRRLGTTRSEAFESVKAEILNVVRFAMSGKFEAIDAIQLSNMFKWKIAFLYSNERLIPIYEKETLDNIAQHYGLDEWNSKISQIQRLMIANKPADLDVYEYMEWLWYNFNSKGATNSALIETDGEDSNIGVRNNLRRRPAKKLNTDSQVRSVARSYVVERKHNKLQQALYNKLVSEFGEKSVVLEEDFVDIKLVQPDRIILYEVKSSSFAGTCVREAIGQLLFYSVQLDDPREKKLVVAGQYPPNVFETQLIQRLRNQLKLDLSYEHIGLD